MFSQTIALYLIVIQMFFDSLNLVVIYIYTAVYNIHKISLVVFFIVICSQILENMENVRNMFTNPKCSAGLGYRSGGAIYSALCERHRRNWMQPVKPVQQTRIVQPDSYLSKLHFSSFLMLRDSWMLPMPSQCCPAQV